MAPMEVVSWKCPSRSQFGGGVYVSTSAVVSFSGCGIHDNEASLSDAGGGVSIVYGTATFSNCEIYANSVSGVNGGGVTVYSSTATFTDCQILSNTASSVRLPLSMAPMEDLSWN